MLRYAKFTIGHYWVPEYGDAEIDRDHFASLYSYSPLHNVRPNVTYPPILVTTGKCDDRVVPAHAIKFLAALQEVSPSGSGLSLLRVQRNAGHGLGKPANKLRELDIDVCTFLMTACDVMPSSGALGPHTV